MSDKTSDKLLNCPFCGGNNVGVWTNHPVSPLIPYSYEAHCYDCHFGLARSNTKDEAIKSWNARKPMERILERLETGQEECYKLFAIGFNAEDRAGYDAYSDAIEIVKEEGGIE